MENKKTWVAPEVHEMDIEATLAGAGTAASENPYFHT